jgi:hypothetical protein
MNLLRVPFRRDRSRRGTTAVETALVLPAFLLFMLGLIELAHAQMVKNILRTACRLAARIGYDAPPRMILMTDGQANQKQSSWSLPANFQGKDWTDSDGNGMADYSSRDNYKRNAFWEATEAVKRGMTIHTIAIGAEADRGLMRAIAFAGGGVFIDVPAHSTIEQMESQLEDAFSLIAAKVPAAQLLYED